MAVAWPCEHTCHSCSMALTCEHTSPRYRFLPNPVRPALPFLSYPFLSHPDMTFAVDWALNSNYLSFPNILRPTKQGAGSVNACWIFSSNMWYRLAVRLSGVFSGCSGLLPLPQVPSKEKLIPNSIIAELALPTTWLKLCWCKCASECVRSTWVRVLRLPVRGLWAMVTIKVLHCYYLKTVTHAILSPCAVYLYLYIYVQVRVHIPGDPQSVQLRNATTIKARHSSQKWFFFAFKFMLNLVWS